MFEISVTPKYNIYLMKLTKFMYKDQNVVPINSPGSLSQKQEQKKFQSNEEIKKESNINNISEQKNSEVNKLISSNFTLEIQGEQVHKGRIVYYTLPDGNNISEKVTIELIGTMGNTTYIILRKQNNELLAISDKAALSLSDNQSHDQLSTVDHDSIENRAA
jgi:hypothetical protein